MRLAWLPLLLVPALTSQAPAPSAVEPPPRYALRCGEEAVEFNAGQSFTIPAAWGGRTCTLESLPLRRFELPGALTFDYADGASWTAADEAPEFHWWRVALGREFVLLQRHRGTGDAAHHLDNYATNSVKSGGEDLGACSILLGGRELSGRRVSGFAFQPFEQEIFGFEHAGETWLLVLQYRDPAPRPLRDRVLASFRFL